MNYSASRNMIQLMLDRYSSAFGFYNIPEYELIKLKETINVEIESLHIEIETLQKQLKSLEDENICIVNVEETQQVQKTIRAGKINKDQGIALYEEGCSVAEIALQFDCSSNAVKNMLKKQGINPEKRNYRRNRPEQE